MLSIMPDAVDYIAKILVHQMPRDNAVTELSDENGLYLSKIVLPQITIFYLWLSNMLVDKNFKTLFHYVINIR